MNRVPLLFIVFLTVLVFGGCQSGSPPLSQNTNSPSSQSANSQPASSAPQPVQMNPTDLETFLGEVTKELGADKTDFGMLALEKWAEFANSQAQWNPLGAPDPNDPAVVPSYPDMQTGVQATVAALQSDQYRAIESTLRFPQDTFNDIYKDRSIKVLGLTMQRWAGQARYTGSPVNEWNKLSQDSRNHLEWGSFENHRVKRLVTEAPLVSENDIKMLAVKLSGYTFDQLATTPNTIHEIFRPAKTNNEFDRRRALETIRQEYEARQRELAKAPYLLTFFGHGKLSQYAAFTEQNGQFTLPPVTYPTTSIVYSDTRVFPRIINTDMETAERVIRENPGRGVGFWVLFKPTGGRSRPQGQGVSLEQPSLVAKPFFVVVVAKLEVLGVFPSQ